MPRDLGVAARGGSLWACLIEWSRRAHSTGDVDAIADFEPGIDRLRFSGVSHFGEMKLGRGMENGIGFAELEWQTRSVRLEGAEFADVTQDLFTFV